MKSRLFALFMMACTSFASINVAYAAENGSKYELDVKDFSQLVVDDGLNVVYKSSNDSAGIAVFTAPKSVADKILFENNKKGKLTIQKAFHEENEMVRDLPVITVYSKFLKEVKNEGDSMVKVIDLRPTTEFKAIVVGNGRLIVRGLECTKFDGSIKTGNGTLVVSGKCESAVLSNTGVGAIQADQLQAKDASCRFFGTGSTGCWVTDVLTVKGVMKGKLYYRDRPNRIRNYSVGVKVYSLEGVEWDGVEYKTVSDKADTTAEEAKK